MWSYVRADLKTAKDGREMDDPSRHDILVDTALDGGNGFLPLRNVDDNQWTVSKSLYLWRLQYLPTNVNTNVANGP